MPEQPAGALLPTRHSRLLVSCPGPPRRCLSLRIPSLASLPPLLSLPSLLPACLPLPTLPSPLPPSPALGSVQFGLVSTTPPSLLASLPPLQYRDLPPDAQLVLVLVEAAEGRREALVGSSVTPLFSKRGRLKTGPQRLAVWEGAPPCTQFPTSTPGKVGDRARVCFSGRGCVSVLGKHVCER